MSIFRFVFPILVSGLMSATPALAQEPKFLAPFPCGQVWRAATYAGHGPFQIDMVELSGSGTIIGENQPSIASAAGRISFDYTWPAGSAVTEGRWGERWIMVDHGGGWRTHYIHLAQEGGRARWAVGRKVAKGEVLGFTSNSGTRDVHLHYAQMNNAGRDAADLSALAATSSTSDGSGAVLGDGTKVHVRLDGRQTKTELANRDSWNFGSSDSEKILSNNCAGGRFALWQSGGDTHILRYAPGARNVRINEIHPTGGNNPQGFNGQWSSDWTTLVPFFAATNNQAYVFAYSFATGKANFVKVSPQFDNLTFTKSVQKYAGWTEIVPITLGDKPHAVFYDSRYGYLNVDEINASSSGFISRLKTTVTKGYTHMVPFEQGSKRYALMYKSSTGFMALQKLTRQSNGSVRREQVWSDRRREGWTHMALLKHRGVQHILGYDQETGQARLWPVRGNGQGLGRAKRMVLDAGWTALTPYLFDSGAHVLAYRLSGGGSLKMRLRDDLSGFRNFTRETWTTGYR